MSQGGWFWCVKPIFTCEIPASWDLAADLLLSGVSMLGGVFTLFKFTEGCIFAFDISS